MFGVAVLLGIAVRVVVMLGFFPAFVYSDGPTYLDLSEHLAPSQERVVGYAVVLKVLLWVTDQVWFVAVVQHVLGLLTAVIGYALLRRWGVGPVVATLGVLPVLFDGMQLVLEHSVLADVVFDLLLLVAVAILAWRRSPRVPAAALAGLALGAAALTKIAGGPVILGAVVLCLVLAAGWRMKLLTTLAVCVAFVVPLLGYAAWYHSVHGVYALSESGGRAKYMRTTGFVDCSRFVVPEYEQRLCPTTPVGQRYDPTFYGWHDPDNTHGLEPPKGMTLNQVFGDFARRAIAAQPQTYRAIVWRDVKMTFAWHRWDDYEYSTSRKWMFDGYRAWLPTDYTGPAYREHGGRLLTAKQPWSGFLWTYGGWVYLPGPVLLALLALVAIATLWPSRWSRNPGVGRSLGFVLAALGMGLVVIPDVTAQFTWRYVLPAFVLVPMAAALAWARLAGRPRPDEARRIGRRATETRPSDRF
ncbi:hypothetical protein D9V37_19115 [Nocardioides mangrovicus]|uniref:Phospholipid carrier-dependent glycosyltransferase n=1 Tax=Nocardioides mangrovicus TaxID=2478913 RepID=A0A3L8NZU3_9ACTN|nr:hypothetical protein D9V37_19115 [Nocardioides mangrovicus]